VKFDLVSTTIAAVSDLFSAHHAYASVGGMSTYAFAVLEGGAPVAAFVWQPPAPGAASSVCATCPQGVLSLSRMVAVPRAERELRHISKPLRVQMRRMIDRTRWPVLVTYSDESVGHTGHVYKCSGWTPTLRKQVDTFTVDGRRVSSYSNGSSKRPAGAVAAKAWIQRWEHWAAEDPAALLSAHWRRVEIAGKRWRSGSQAHRYEPITSDTGPTC
jgi:hypothetical protein